jgi:hypothetical protein
VEVSQGFCARKGDRLNCPICGECVLALDVAEAPNGAGRILCCAACAAGCGAVGESLESLRELQEVAVDERE